MGFGWSAGVRLKFRTPLGARPKRVGLGVRGGGVGAASP